MAYQVVITDCPWEDISVERAVLQEIGAKVHRFDCRSPDEVIEVAYEADALLVGWAPIDRTVIQALTRCRIMVRYGAGYNNVDVDAATAAGIAVANNPDYCVDEVATHALALLLACHRQLLPLTSAVRNGVWDPAATLRPMPRLSEQTAGIIGYGRIGRRLAAMARPLVARVLISDPVNAGNDDGIESGSLDEVLAASDYVSLHAPLTAETQHLICDETLRRMKRGACLINCSRGPLVDESALLRALRSGHLGGAALDVFETEPLPMDHPLRSLPNVVITPHAAWYSQTADHLLRALPARTVRDFLTGKPVRLLNEPAFR